MMTERELRLCVEGTVSEAIRLLESINPEMVVQAIMPTLNRAVAEIESARSYARTLAKNT